MGLEGAARDAAGIICQIIATFLAALAYVLQKQAHKTLPKGDNVYLTTNWRAGFAAMVIVAGIDAWSFSLLDQSKLACFGAVTLAWTVVLAWRILKEHFGRVDLAAVIFISAGTALALSAGAPSTDFTFLLIIQRVSEPAAIVYAVFAALGVAGGGLWVERTDRAALASGTPLPRHFAPLSALTGGYCMGFTGLAIKGLSTAVFNGEWESLKHMSFYWFVLLLIVALTAQVRYLNKGLAAADAMTVVPVFQAGIIVSNAVGGAVFFGDLDGVGAGGQAAFVFGCLSALIGALALSTKKPAIEIATPRELLVAENDKSALLEWGVFPENELLRGPGGGGYPLAATTTTFLVTAKPV